MAGVLACGSRTAVISHFSAAIMWGMLTETQVRHDQKDHRLHVSSTQGRSRPPRIRIHRVKPIYNKDRHTIDGVPVTSPARTLLDIASDPKTKLLGPAVNEGRIKRLVTNDSLQAVINRYPNMAGIQALAAQLVDSSYSRSKAETLMKQLLETHNLPPAKQNQPLLGHEVDFIWPEHDLILEVNGFVFHSSRHKFDKDNSKVADLRLAGYDVIEVGWPQITKQPDLVSRLVRDGLVRSEKRGLKKS